MKKFLFQALLATICSFSISSSSYSGLLDSDECSCCLYNDPFRVSAAGVVGEGYGHDNREASFSGFFASEIGPEDNWVPFLDVRGHYLAHHRWAANAGLGLRWLDRCNSLVWGGNVFYDYREGKHKPFNQVGLGIEVLSACWDFRLNGYIPVGTRVRSGDTEFFYYPGNYFASCTSKEESLTGLDAEVGTTLFCCSDISFYAAVGTYYFRSEHRNNIWGGSTRLAVLFSEYVSLEARITYDNEFNLKAQGILQLTIPFDFCSDACDECCSLCRSTLLQPVIRKEVIPVSRYHCWHSNF